LRLTVVVLLAINLLLFAYLSWRPADRGALDNVGLPQDATSLNVPSLVMTNELLPVFAEPSLLQLKGISKITMPGAKPCLAAGPIDTKSRAVSVAAYINSRGRSAEVAALATPSHNGFQLFIGPIFSAASAEDRRRELELMGLTVNRVEDEAGLGLSLGLFATEDEASAKLAELEKLGLEASLRPLFLEEEQFWLILAWGEEARDAVSASVEGLKAIVPELADVTLRYCLRQG
jgi:hypothetical protein